MQNYIGKQIDRYRIIERLGMGGMAVVYKAYDTRLERDVALKLIRVDEIPASQHDRLFKRFEREAKAQARFSHRNIIPVHDYGEVDGSPYLVMAYIPGGTLKDRLHGPVNWQQAVRWLIPVAEALSYAHHRGVIHRDVKPANILFDDEDQPILTDFGIAKVLETDEATLTGTGMGVGTPEYMAPEQWQGKTSEATDQYALGVVLYELITGKKPYSADTPAAVAIMQATEPLAPPSGLVMGIPEEVEKVLYKALARDPQDRYESMNAFMKALKGIIARSNEGPTEKKTEEIILTPDEIFEKKRPIKSSLSAFEIEHADIPSNEMEPEGETFDVLSVTPKKEAELSKEGPPKNQKTDNTNPTNIIPKEEPKTDPTRANKIAIPIVVGIFLILCIVAGIAIIGPLGIYSQWNKTQEQGLSSDSKTSTAEIITTSTAQAQATATMKVKKTATAIAQVTATAQTAMNIFYEYVDTANLVYEEKSGSLEHKNDDYVETLWIDEDLKDFALEITFTNPYDNSTGDWGYGILFRQTGSNDQYRLYVASDNFWYFGNWEGSIVSDESGMVNLHMGEGKENKLQFLALDEVGYFFVNDQYVTELDLTERDYSGDILIGTGFMNNHEVDGYFTDFKELAIYNISGESTGTSTELPSEENLSITVEETENMHYFRVIDDEQDLNYRIGPISSSQINNYHLALSPNNGCFAYIVGSTVYYSIIGDNSIYFAGDISKMLIIEEGGSGESEFLELTWSNWESRLYVDDILRGYETSQFYMSFPAGTLDQCILD